MLVLSVKGETKGPKTDKGKQQESYRLFMGDLASTIENLVLYLFYFLDLAVSWVCTLRSLKKTLVQTIYLLDKLIEKVEVGKSFCET